MSYLTQDLSVDNGAPKEWYEFISNGVATNFYTGDWKLSLQNGTISYCPIIRSNITANDNPFKSNLTLRAPLDSELATLMINRDGTTPVTVTIRRLHVTGTGENSVYWKGRVTGFTLNGNEISIECESVFSAILNTGLRARYETTCRHVLYGTLCGASITSNRQVFHPGLILGQSEFSFAYSTKHRYTGGAMIIEGNGRLNGLSRSVVSDTGSGSGRIIRITHGFYNWKAGPVTEAYTVYLVPGCDHTINDCHNKFQNVNNYGGFPFIPSDNPFTTNQN